MEFQRHKFVEKWQLRWRHPKRYSLRFLVFYANLNMTWRTPVGWILVEATLLTWQSSIEMTMVCDMSSDENVHDFTFTDNGPWSSIHQYGFIKLTLQGTNISPKNDILSRWFSKLPQVGFLLISWRVCMYHKESHGPKIGPSLLKSWLGWPWFNPSGTWVDAGN